MIFQTITNESTGAIKSIGLFAKSVEDLKNFNLKEFFFEKSDIDSDAVHKYNALINDNIPAQKALKEASEGTTNSTIALMKAANGAQITEANLTKAMKAATLAGKAQQVAWKGLALALNTALNIGAMFLFSAIVDGIQQIATYSDRLAEKASEVGSAFKESQNDIESYKAKSILR